MHKSFSGAQWNGVSIRKRATRSALPHANATLHTSRTHWVASHDVAFVPTFATRSQSPPHLIILTAVLTKVQYECLPAVFSSRKIWIHIGISFVLNWIAAPLIMLGLAWATLPEASLERERKGVILVGVGVQLHSPSLRLFGLTFLPQPGVSVCTQ